MVQPDKKFFFSRNCTLLKQEGNQSPAFLDSSIKATTSSYFSRDMFNMDANGNATFEYTFESGEKPPPEDPNRMCEKTNWLGQVKLKKCAPKHSAR